MPFRILNMANAVTEYSCIDNSHSIAKVKKKKRNMGNILSLIYMPLKCTHRNRVAYDAYFKEKLTLERMTSSMERIQSP